MEQVNLLIANTDHGWAVSFRGLPLMTAETKSGAIQAASAHALDRFAVTGQAVGVVLRMGCGDEVLIDLRDSMETGLRIDFLGSS